MFLSKNSCLFIFEILEKNFQQNSPNRTMEDPDIKIIVRGNRGSNRTIPFKPLNIRSIDLCIQLDMTIKPITHALK